MKNKHSLNLRWTKRQLDMASLVLLLVIPFAMYVALNNSLTNIAVLFLIIMTLIMLFTMVKR